MNDLTLTLQWARQWLMSAADDFDRAEFMDHVESIAAAHVTAAEDRMREAVEAVAAEWERDDAEHVATHGQHLPGSVGRMAELLRAALAPTAHDEGAGL